MAIYTAILPNGQPYQLQGPEGASAEDIQAAGLQLYAQNNPAPYVDNGERNYTLGQAGSKGLSRGMERVKSTFGDVIPAQIASAFGADEYAERQMSEARASEDLINRKYRAELQSYKDVQSIGDAIKFGVETIGEQLPNLGVMAVPGAGAGQLARVGALKMAPAAFAKRQATAEGIGVYLGSFALNSPEVFQNIYEETGELATGTSLLFGAAAASLDAVLPAAIVKNLTPLQRLGISKAVIKKSGARPGLVESVFKGLAKGAATEGVTEGMQEAISISAENFVGDNPQIFESEDWDRIMESSVRGAVAGGAFRGVSSPLERAPAEPAPLTAVELEYQKEIKLRADRVAKAKAAEIESDTTGVIPAAEVPAAEVPAAEVPAAGPVGEGGTNTGVPPTEEEIIRSRDAAKVVIESNLPTFAKINPTIAADENSFIVDEVIKAPKGQLDEYAKFLYSWDSNSFQWVKMIEVGEKERLEAKRKQVKKLGLTIVKEEKNVPEGAELEYASSQIARDKVGQLYKYNPLAENLWEPLAGEGIEVATPSEEAAAAESDQESEYYTVDKNGKVVINRKAEQEAFENFTEEKEKVLNVKEREKQRKALIKKMEYDDERVWRIDSNEDIPFNQRNSLDVYDSGRLGSNSSFGHFEWTGSEWVSSSFERQATGLKILIENLLKVKPKATPKAKATPEVKPNFVDPKTPVAKAWASFIPDILFAKLGKVMKDRVRDAVKEGYFNLEEALEIYKIDKGNKQNDKSKNNQPSEAKEAKEAPNVVESDYVDGTPATLGGTNKLTAKEFREEAKETLGESLEKMIKNGRVYIADTVNDVPDRFKGNRGTASVSDGTVAYFMWEPGARDKRLNGVILVIASRVTKGDARKVMLHEVGEHYGLEVLLGNNYMPTLLQLNKLKDTDPVVAEAWASVLSRYVGGKSKILEGDKNFLSEVAARIGESAPENTWWKQFVAKIKSALRKLGFYDPEKVTSADIQDFIITSLDRAMKEPGPVEKLRAGDNVVIKEARSEANQEQLEVFDKELDGGKTINEMLGPDTGGHNPKRGEGALKLAGNVIKAVQEGTPGVIDDVINKLSNLPDFLRESYQGLLGIPAMISLYGRFLPSIKKLQSLLEIRAGTATKEREYIDLMGNLGMNAIKGKERREFKIYKKTKDKDGNEIKGEEITLEDFKGEGKARVSSSYVVELSPRTTVTEQYTQEQIDEWSAIVYEMSTTNSDTHPFGIDPTNPANSELSIVKDFYNKTPKELQLIAILYASQFNQFANQFNANVLALLPDTTKDGVLLTPSQKKEAFKTQLIENQLVFYQPLVRKGPYRIAYLPDGATEISVERVKTKREMDQRVAVLQSKGAREFNIGREPEQSRRGQDVPNAFFAKIIAELEESLMPKINELDDNGVPTGRVIRDPDGKMEEHHQKMIDDIYGFYLDLFPSNSVKQAVRKREGIAGYNVDIVGGFIDVGARMANQVTNMEYIPKFNETLNDIRTESMDSGAKMIELDDTLTTDQKQKKIMLIKSAAVDLQQKGSNFMNNPVAGNIAGNLSYLSFMTTIAGNVSSALVNLTQVLIIVIPGLIAKHGPVNGMRAFNQALKLYMSGGWDNNKGYAPDVSFAMKDGVRRSQENADKGFIKQDEVISQELLDLYDYGVLNSVFKRGLGYELTEMRNKSSQDFTGNRAKVEGILGWMFQNTERFNREVTFTSSFLADRKAGKSIEQAREEAQDFTREAHGTALPEIGPRYFQTGWGKTMFTFKRYGHAMLSLIAKLFYQSMKGNEQERSDIANEIAKLGTDPKNKEQVDLLNIKIENLKQIKSVARKQLLGIYGISFTVAGLQGMPLYGAANVLSEMINALVEDDDDEFYDFDASVRDIFGDIGYKGPLNKLLNLDVASRTGFNNLIFRDDSRRLGEVGLPTYLLEMSLGPSFSYALSLSRAAKDFDQGNIQRGTEQMMPAFLRNPLKAIRYANEGARNRKGAELTDLNGFDAFMQVFGFTNEDLSLQYEINNVRKRAERKILDRRSALLTAAYLAKSSGDMDLYSEVLEKIEIYNNSPGGQNSPITRSTRDASYKSTERSIEESMNGITITKKQRDYLQKTFQ